MKKQLSYSGLLIALTLGAMGTSQAQDLDFGVHVGSIYNMPSYGNKAVRNKKAEFGAQVGVFARTRDRFYFQPELAFSFLSASYTYADKELNPNFYQLSLPLQAGYKLYEDEKVSLRGSVGPQLNYQLKKTKASLNNNYKEFSYEALVNIGLDYQKYSLDLRYNHGLHKTNKELDVKTRSLGIAVGYRF